jgi:hypothetical protein
MPSTQDQFDEVLRRLKVLLEPMGWTVDKRRTDHAPRTEFRGSFETRDKLAFAICYPVPDRYLQDEGYAECLPIRIAAAWSLQLIQVLHEQDEKQRPK